MSVLQVDLTYQVRIISFDPIIF